KGSKGLSETRGGQSSLQSRNYSFAFSGPHPRKSTLTTNLPNNQAGNPIPDPSLLPLLPSVQNLFRSFCDQTRRDDQLGGTGQILPLHVFWICHAGSRRSASLPR